MWTPPADEVVQNSGGWTPPADERVDDTPARPEKTLGGLASNAVSDTAGMIGGVVNTAMHPFDTVKNVATHLPEIGHSMLHSWGLDSADKGHRLQTLADESYEHPVSHVLDAASVAFPAAKALGIGEKAVEGLNIAGKAEKAADSLEHTSDLFRAKDIGARTKQFLELDEDEAARLGRRMKTEGISGSARDMKAQAKALDAAEGKKVGDFRRAGDAAGAAPDFHAVMEAIKKQFAPKYAAGEHAGSAGEFQNALDSVGKLAPKETPGIPALEQVTPKPGAMNLVDDPRLASKAIETTKDVPGMKQMVPDSGQMDLLDAGQPELFPKNPTEGILAPEMKKTPLAGQSNVPDLSGQQELMPSDSFKSSLVEKPTSIVENPGVSDFAKKATDLNKFAAGKGKLLQANDATTDVANALSAQNDQSLVQHLGADKGKAYLEALRKESDAKKLYQMASEKRARQLGKTTAPSSLPAQMWHGVTDRFGYSLTAKGLDTLAAVVRKSPELLGKYGPALANLGPAALATTAHVLLQKDPEFAETLNKAGIPQ